MDALPTVLIPGLMETPAFYQAQLPALWRFGPVMVADHTRDDSMAGIARRVLADAPPRFALIGHSMGGYVTFEILRQAQERVVKLVLLDTAARADSVEQAQARGEQIASARAGEYHDVFEKIFPKLVHESRLGDAPLFELMRTMALQTGAAAFARQQTANANRVDSRPGLGSIRCPTLVVVGDGDQVTPVDRAREIADGIDGAALVVLERCGHSCAIERPAEVTRTLMDWLA